MVSNPEFRSQCVQRGYFPEDEQFAVKLSPKGVAFYELLLNEWWTTGNRLLVHGRLMTLVRQAGYKAIGSALHDFEKKRLIDPVGRGGRKRDGVPRRVIARPYTGLSKKTKVVFPRQCKTEGICVNDSIWCLPADSDPVSMQSNAECRMYERLLPMIEGSDGHRFKREILSKIGQRELGLKNTSDILDLLVLHGFLRVVPSKQVECVEYELIVRPYISIYPWKDKGDTKVPELCQPPAGIHDQGSDPIQEDEPLPPEADDVITPEEEEVVSPDPEPDVVTEAVPLTLTSISTPELMSELLARIRREWEQVVTQEMDRIERDHIHKMRELFLAKNPDSIVVPHMIHIENGLNHLSELTEEHRRRYKQIEKLRDLLVGNTSTSS